MTAWKKLKTEVVHKNPWFSLRRDEVLRPNGVKGEYYYMDAHDAVAIIVEDEDAGIYLVGQTRYPVGNKYSWEVVGGGIDEGEMPLEAAKRELKEETGIEATEWIDLGEFNVANFSSAEVDYVFLARNLKKGEANPDETEDLSLKKITLDELKEMIKNSEMMDGFSLAAIIKYLLYKDNI